MMVNRKFDHWWEWAGEFTKDAMKGWGLGALSFMAVLAAIIYLAVMHGGNYLDASAEKMRAEAKSSLVVADAVTKLTAVAKAQEERTDKLECSVEENGVAIKRMLAEGSVPAQQVKDMMEGATKLMSPVPGLREQANRLLEAQGIRLDGLIEVNKEILQALKDQSKNALTPPLMKDGGA
jgi:hypothetical protein